MKYRIDCFLVIICLLLSCKHTQPIASDVKHAFGKTQRIDSFPYDCKKITPDELKQQGASPPDYTAATTYVKNLARYIMDKNPGTFKDGLSPDNFCFYVVRNDEYNAYATQPIPNILIFDTYLAEMKSEAEVAATLSHELSHLTMGQARFSGSHPDLEADPTYLKQKMLNDTFDSNDPLAKKKSEIQSNFFRELTSISGPTDEVSFAFEWVEAQSIVAFRHPERQEEADAEIAQSKVKVMESLDSAGAKDRATEIWGMITQFAQVSIDVLKEKQRQGIDLFAQQNRILGSDHEAIMANWMEQEADEVGYELYLRAGFKASAYSEQLEDLRTPPDEKAKCKAQIESIRKGLGGLVDRGESDHPSDCWRILDISVLEADKHSRDYAPLLKDATRLEIFPGELGRVKATLKVPKT